jgi:S1-C subfamily serine protease
VSLALARPTVERVAAGLLEHGRVRRGYLGVSVQPVRLPEAAAADLGQRRGAMVVGVEPGSPADEAGLALGDVIVGLGDDAVSGVDDLLAALHGDVVGRALAVRFLRGGEPAERTVQVGERG